MPIETTEVTINGVLVDTKKADTVLVWLIRREAENVRTKAKSDVQMIADIQKYIEGVAQCY